MKGGSLFKIIKVLVIIVLVIVLVKHLGSVIAFVEGCASKLAYGLDSLTAWMK